jgi:hypothetical protein
LAHVLIPGTSGDVFMTRAEMSILSRQPKRPFLEDQ